jgi:MCP family monocarboxylic acid transporter-like MFS transporter 10
MIFQVEALYFTYGILFGLGASLAYTPSLAILGLHFRQKMGMVNGLVTAGSSAFTVILPPLLGAIMPWAGLQGVLRFLAICMACLMGNALLFKVCFIC